ncbi:uncharacterized protein [Spinacia oleracea]|uniref:Uncharacterized protein n=1 Tax=Spinacia oleracea TaxID=3562 RepID=A0ABM3RDP2_SPIOL|nr:uncharacterized protein LOC130468091 [Spinacia oleracea]
MVNITRKLGWKVGVRKSFDIYTIYFSSYNILFKCILVILLNIIPKKNIFLLKPDIYTNNFNRKTFLAAGARLGGVIMPPRVWMGTLDHELSTQGLNEHGYLIVSNLLPGLWIADVYTGNCVVCEAVCGETKTILSLWHSNLHLME